MLHLLGGGFKSASAGGYPTNSLLSYYPLESNSTDIISGLNGTDTSMTYVNGIGQFGYGANFDGVASKIVLPNVDISGPRSYSIWLALPAAPASAKFIFHEQKTGSTLMRLTTSAPRPVNSLYREASAATTLVVNSPGLLADAAIHHVAFSAGQNNGNLWIDGTLIGTDTSGNIDSPTQTSVDRILGYVSAYGYTRMYASGLGIFQRELVQADVDAIWNGGAGTYP